jgi:hypothetical protein
VRGRERGQGGKGRVEGKGGEMTQTLYAHMNKRKKFLKRLLGMKTKKKKERKSQVDYFLNSRILHQFLLLGETLRISRDTQG